ncbi:MAG TPA: purine-binding chemotaxis protein CheW [Deltaproteobacteria bacterium]|nr:purine-binding chemotaxis protein CheW [Deltaproteobacteria bacterium]
MSTSPESVEEDAHETNDDKHLTFVIGEGSYALHISHVTEIIEMQTVTSIPNAPRHVRGIINLRGKVIPVVDVRACLCMEERPYDSRTCIIVVHEESPVGLVVDTVREVVDVPPEAVLDAPAVGEHSDAGYITGIAKMEDSTQIILDFRKLLASR